MQATCGRLWCCGKCKEKNHQRKRRRGDEIHTAAPISMPAHPKAADCWALRSFESEDTRRWWRTDGSGRSAADLDARPSAALPLDTRTSRCCRSSPTALPSPRTDRSATWSTLRLRVEPLTEENHQNFHRGSDSRVSHLWTSVQAVQKMRLAGAPHAGDDVRQVQRLAVRISDRDVEHVLDRLPRADLRLAELLLQVLVVTDDALHRFVVVAVVVYIVGVAQRRWWRRLLIRVLVVDIKFISFAIYHFVKVLHGLRRCGGRRRILVLSRAENIDDGLHRAMPRERNVVEHRKVVLVCISEMKIKKWKVCHAAWRSNFLTADSPRVSFWESRPPETEPSTRAVLECKLSRCAPAVPRARPRDVADPD